MCISRVIQDVVELCMRNRSTPMHRLVVQKAPGGTGVVAADDSSSGTRDEVSQSLLSGEIVIEKVLLAVVLGSRGCQSCSRLSTAALSLQVHASFLHPYSDGSNVRVPGTLYLTNYQLIFHGVGETLQIPLGNIQRYEKGKRGKGSLDVYGLDFSHYIFFRSQKERKYVSIEWRRWRCALFWC